MKTNQYTFGQRLFGKIVGMAISSPLAAWNYWGGIVALFTNHPTYYQVWSATTIIMVPLMFKSWESAGKGHLAKTLQLATLVAFFSWVLRLVGIMPNAPF